MEYTGRLTKAVVESARRIVFDKPWDECLQELRAIAYVDRVHLLMLADCGLATPDTVRRLMGAILALQEQDFEPLRCRPVARGVYLMYEDYLIETEGSAVGGVLQTARSRNDLNATTAKVRLRPLYMRLVQEGLRLQSALLRTARRYATVVMPGYTHYQAAVPITYGHYLAGVATALDRDLGWILQAADGLRDCPLGAGALGGTELPIDTRRTSRLLGFERGPLNSVDAVASRDLQLRLLAATSIYMLSLARVATDLLHWQTAEFGFLNLPDELVGSSSAMPQKRNPFLLEHVRGRAGIVVGALAGSMTAMHAAPFSNSIEVSSEALASLPATLTSAADMSHLASLIIRHARPNCEAMLRRAEEAGTTGTAYANQIARSTGVPFRTAHRMVGEMARASDGANGSFSNVGAALRAGCGEDQRSRVLDPAWVCAAAYYGGGPASSSLRRCLSHLRLGLCEKHHRQREQQRRWRAADETTANYVAKFLAGPKAPRTAVYYFCLDSSQDPVAGRVWEEVQHLHGPAELYNSNGLCIRSCLDKAGNRYVFIGTRDLIAENWPRYKPLLTAYARVDFVGLLNWHEGTNGPDRILCFHSNGDVASGHFGRVDPTLNKTFATALEANRVGLGLSDWTTLIEATHWAGSRCGASAELLADDDQHVVNIEIGSSPESWCHTIAIRVVAQTLVEVFNAPARPSRNLLAVGGRHFEPVFTSVMLGDNGVALSHVLPNRALVEAGYERAESIDLLRSCVLSVKGGVQGIVYHDSIKSAMKLQLRAFADPLNIEVLSHRQLRRHIEATIPQASI